MNPNANMGITEKQILENLARYGSTIGTTAPATTPKTAQEIAADREKAGLNRQTGAPLTQAEKEINAAGTSPITTSPVRRYTGSVESPYSEFADSVVGGLDTTMPTAQDEDAIKAEQIRLVEKQLASIDAATASMLAGEERNAAERLGRTRAMSARGGRLGSTFGEREFRDTENLNAQARNAIAAAQQEKKVQILDRANSRATELIEADKNRTLKNIDTRLSFLKEKQEEARNDLKMLAGTGVSYDSLSTEERNTLSKQTGFDEATLRAQFLLNKPKASILKEITEGSTYTVVSRDPITGEVKAESTKLNIVVPPNYKIQKLDDGTILFVPEKFDPAKPIKDQIITYGTQSESYALELAQKRATLEKTQNENRKALLETETDQAVVADVQDAQAAIDAGANADEVRRRFLDKYPKKGDFFLKYTKQEF